MATPRLSTSYSYASTSYQNGYTTSTSQPPYGPRPSTSRPGTARPSSRRSRAGSAIGGGESQQIICAVTEGRGITPTVGLAFVNISTGEAVLSQICDNQFYARTLNKLQVFEPTEILIVSTAAPPHEPSKMYRVVEENIIGARMVAVDRKYWSETTGLEFLQQLAFSRDLDALRVAIGGNYFATCLKLFHDVEKLLTNLIIIPTQPDIRYLEQSVNHILMLKGFVEMTPRIFEILGGARSELLVTIRENCCHENSDATISMIKEVINEDVTFQKTPLDLRNQRIYAAGISGLLDVARQTFKEATADVHQHVSTVNQEYQMQTETCFDNNRRYYLRVIESDFEGRGLPDILINRYRKKGFIECQTIDLVKLNQRLEDAHEEVICMSDKTVQDLLDNIRGEIPSLFKVCESIALLDMIAAFAHLATNSGYTKPEIGDAIAIERGRHPVKEKDRKGKSNGFIPNDVYASDQTRFQIITGCNMSGKSTYIRSVALLSVMAQVGSFVPAEFATFRIIRQLFARVSVDDSIEANVSTFASEMRETAFILRNVDTHSLVIIDELGRGTSTRDGLAIALSIAEALVQSRALIWFVTHFRELGRFSSPFDYSNSFLVAQILDKRPGVVNYHLGVDMSIPNTMTMTYKIQDKPVEETHYGLALARLVELPPKVLEVAETVSKTLDEQVERKKRGSKARAIASRRKLVMNLKEQLTQALDCPMDDRALLGWLRKLQGVFVVRMEEIENTEDHSSDDDDEEGEEEVEEEGEGRGGSDNFADQEETGEDEHRSSNGTPPAHS
ncbi:hypothetical protein G7Y89_g2882 [Cudoniella acicularis]|uniref:DNA mismatch repair protein MSH3 n=1 Tax=Cudoniella acicularis TaxID=354080 RepID=A0A8H4RSI4_9HELO|nr:hypothetical protein G7Y89_g2882 [Cudoniella acicularis]